MSEERNAAARPEGHAQHQESQIMSHPTERDPLRRLSAGRRGHAASLPDPGYVPPARIRMTDTTCTVLFYPESGGRPKSFDFQRLPVHHDLRLELAQAFERTVGPTGISRTYLSAVARCTALSGFARFVATLSQPPCCAAEITVAHIDSYVESRRQMKSWRQQLGAFRSTLLTIETLPTPVRARLNLLVTPSRVVKTMAYSYSRAEESRIVQAARRDLCAAAERIRASMDFLVKWRAGEIDQSQDRLTWERGYLLDQLITSGDLPRDSLGRRAKTDMIRRAGGICSIVQAMCLTHWEAAAACILLISATGVNGQAISTLSLSHERADNGLDEPPIALIDVVKPRRGQRTRYMSIPLSDVPSWIGAFEAGEVTVQEAEEMMTPFGIYTLLRELTAPARKLCGSQQLFLWASTLKPPRDDTFPMVREGVQRASVPQWGERARLVADPGNPESETGLLYVRMSRLRRTYLQRTQQPVAHSVRTLADVYLPNDLGGLAESQQVVAEVQMEQVTRAREHLRVQVLSAHDMKQAAQDPTATAQQFGMSVDVLHEVVDGRRNTVLAACIDFHHSPFAPDGSPCISSFLLCLSCPCARVTPQHLPVLLVAREMLDERRHLMTSLAWANIFAGPHAQLDEVIGRFTSATIEAACADITDADRELVQRLLGRELDLT